MVVYHYTSVATLLAILETRCWHLTNIGFLNDGSEYHYAWELAKRFIPALNSYEDTRERIPGVWVSCFSMLDDNFSQWNLYGDGGCGVAIGVELHEVQHSIEPIELFMMDQSAVNYSRERQESEIATLVSHLATIEDGEWAYEDCIARVAQFAKYWKQPQFMTEQEVRIAAEFPWQTLHSALPTLLRWRESADRILKYKVSNRILRPYLELPLIDFRFIRSVTIGPRSRSVYHRGLIEQILRRRVSTHRVPVLDSEISPGQI